MHDRSTVVFLGLWERLHNPQFNCLEFEAIESEAGMNAFVLTPKRWVETTNAHKDIAFEFASSCYDTATSCFSKYGKLQCNTYKTREKAGGKNGTVI